MTLDTQIRSEVQESYEPTISDRIQRVLYRLDHGEELVFGTLNADDKFCLVGLFGAESGLFGDGMGNCSNSYLQIYDLYNIKSHINVRALPEVLQKLIRDIYGTCGTVPLPVINDVLVSQGVEDRNSIMADLIRSGIIFRGYSHSDS